MKSSFHFQLQISVIWRRAKTYFWQQLSSLKVGVDIACNYSWLSFSPSPECLDCYWASWCCIKAADVDEGHALEVCGLCKYFWDWDLPLCVYLPFSAHLLTVLEQNDFAMMIAGWNEYFLVIFREALSTCKIFLIIDQELSGSHELCCCRSDWKSISSVLFLTGNTVSVYLKKKKAAVENYSVWMFRGIMRHN